jgi:long-chain acyl-CoA synthetase
MKSLSQLYNNIQDNSGDPFVVLESQTIRYSDLYNSIRYFVGMLNTNGIKSGQRITVCSQNDAFLSVASIASFFHGVTCILLPKDITSLRLQAIVEKSEPSLILFDEDTDSINALDNKVKTLGVPQAISSTTSSFWNIFKSKKSTGWQSMLEQYDPCEPSLPSDLSQNCFICFTSGTTGAPKGVQITYGNLLTHLETISRVFDYSGDSRILNNMMLVHVDGLFQGPMLALYNKARLYRPCNMDIQNIEVFLNTVYRERITHLITVPTVLSFIERVASQDDYFTGGDFRHFISVAGLLDINLWKHLEKRFSIRINNMYGLTETVTGGLFCGPSDDTFSHGSVGKPIDMQVRVVDLNGKDVEQGEEGELWLAGDNVFTGYYNEPQKTAEVFTQEWFHTGDLVKINQQGLVVICGRIKELIITGGFNVHPAEVNEALMSHAEVAEVATLGMPDDDWQEVVVSAVVLKSDADISERELISYCRDKLEPKKVPRNIYKLDSLPRGDAGKVKLAELQKQLLDIESTNNSQSSSMTAEQLLTLASEAFKVEKSTLSLKSQFGEVPGWDSLGHLDLAVRVEKAIGRKLTPQEIIKMNPLGGILEFCDD